MTFCKYCQGITIEGLRDKCQPYQHAPSFEVLSNSAGSCTMCDLLWKAAKSGAGCEPCLEDLTKMHKKAVVLEGWPDHRNMLSCVNISSYGEGDFSFPGRVFGKVSLFATPESPATSFISGREVTSDMGSPAAFELVGSWIRECATQHVDCFRLPEKVLQSLPGAGSEPLQFTKKSTHSLEEQPLPPRVINVGPRDGSREPYLLDNSGNPYIRGYYIALSHCWGLEKPITTTKSTYNERVRGIPMATLPQTFRDAITITRTLGIKYLWTDSLCIVQDFEEDWETQSALMGGIYALSFLTINASGSPDSWCGCFARGFSASDAVIFRPTDSPGEIGFTEYIAETPFTKSQVDYTGDRAWCLQETVLPQRVAIYGSRMLGWLCNTKRISQQNGELGTAVGLRMEGGWDKQYDLQRWAFIVRNYTERNITYEKDKLVALSGLAGQIEHILKDDYLAGIWRKNLVDGLLWSVVPGHEHTRPSEYRAPSWSWASIEGPIMMKVDISAEDNLAAKILDCRIDAVGKNTLGQVSGGMLKLSGPMQQMCFPSELKSKDMTVRTKLIGRETNIIITCTFDISGEECWSEKDVFFLGMTTRRGISNREASTHLGLLISPVAGGASFSRVGLASMQDSQGFDNFSTADIVLV